MKPAVAIGRERREEPGARNVRLRRRGAGGDERRGGCHEERQAEHDRAEAAPPVAQQTPHAARLPRRIRGSAHVAAASASRFPATTRAALTVVAAMTSG